MEFCISNARFGAHEAMLTGASGERRAALLTGLAWHARQRDPARARAWVREALPLVESLADAAGRAACLRRLTLAQAEDAWLCGRLAEADALAAGVLAQAREAGDDCAAADAAWVRAWIATDGGRPAERDAALADALGSVWQNKGVLLKS